MRSSLRTRDPYAPWTVVLDEQGPVDPRFRGSSSAVHVRCNSVAVYTPKTPATATPLRVTNAGDEVKGIVLEPVSSPILPDEHPCLEFLWPAPLKQRSRPPAAASASSPGTVRVSLSRTSCRRTVRWRRSSSSRTAGAWRLCPSRRSRRTLSVRRFLTSRTFAGWARAWSIPSRSIAPAWRQAVPQSAPSAVPADGHHRGLSQVRDNDPRSPVRGDVQRVPDSERAELIRRGVTVTIAARASVKRRSSCRRAAAGRSSRSFRCIVRR